MTLNLNCANFYDEKGKRPNFPPEGLKKHPQDIDRNSIKGAIEKGEDTLVISAHNTDERTLAKKAAKMNAKSGKADSMMH